MPLPYTGRCLCDATRYRVTEEPLTLFACHCTDCGTRLWSEPPKLPGVKQYATQPEDLLELAALWRDRA